jgi:hypothetical protein
MSRSLSTFFGMSTHATECRIVHRNGLTHNDRLTLLVAVLNWAEANGLTLHHFHSRFSPLGEFRFMVQVRTSQVIDDLMACLPRHAVETVEIDGQSRQ